MTTTLSGVVGEGEAVAKIYGGIEGIDEPEHTADWETYGERAEEYVQKVVDHAKQNGGCPEAGKEIHFAVADGRARYIVFSLKPVVLIHLNVSDGYQFQYINRLTAGDVRAELKREEAMRKLFNR